jgi:hypothetical protein
MTNVNDFVVAAFREAAERGIEEKVYAKIKRDILHLKFIGGAGAFLATGLILFHQPIFSYVVNRGGDQFKKDIRDEIKTTTDELTGKLSQARAIHDTIDAMVNKYLALVIEQKQAVSVTKGELEDQLNRVSDSLRLLREQKSLVDERIKTAQSSADATSKELNETIERVHARLNELIQNQNEIVAQLKTISPNLPQIKAVPASPPKQPDIVRKGTVYFQFGGFSRPEAQAISAALKTDGWTIPGEENVPFSLVNEIRYNPADEKAAALLVQDANKVLQDLQISRTLAAKQNNAVKPGIIEIWLSKSL